MQHSDIDGSPKAQELDFIEDPLNPRSKTSLRMLYEAQVAVIQKQIGDLETIRTDLGLSQRKMSQLLLVDPSSWTRWTRKGDQVPPHIWRALQWYLTLREKIPGLTPQYFIGQDPKVLYEKTMLKIDEERQKRGELERSLRSEISELEKTKQKIPTTFDVFFERINFGQRFAFGENSFSVLDIACSVRCFFVP